MADFALDFIAYILTGNYSEAFSQAFFNDIKLKDWKPAREFVVKHIPWVFWGQFKSPLFKKMKIFELVRKSDIFCLKFGKIQKIKLPLHPHLITPTFQPLSTIHQPFSFAHRRHSVRSLELVERRARTFRTECNESMGPSNDHALFGHFWSDVQSGGAGGAKHSSSVPFVQETEAFGNGSKQELVGF